MVLIIALEVGDNWPRIHDHTLLRSFSDRSVEPPKTEMRSVVWASVEIACRLFSPARNILEGI
ncbi:MAG: hypothetical protein ACYDH9_22800 [Limisphaerales bacterium]